MPAYKKEKNYVLRCLVDSEALPTCVVFINFYFYIWPWPCPWAPLRKVNGYQDGARVVSHILLQHSNKLFLLCLDTNRSELLSLLTNKD